jgi:chemotaxis protein MotB
VVALASAGGWGASRSIAALEERGVQWEHEAAESEGRVAELHALREAMERRLRVLEQQRLQADLGGDAAALQARGAQARQARREEALATLGRTLKDALAAEDAFLDLDGDALRVELSDRLLFEPGGATLTEGGRKLLAGTAAVLAPLTDHRVEVAAHTDEPPAGTDATPWELSAARAVVVVRDLGEHGGLAPERLSATGHASFRPVVPADSPPHRARNRRVELRVSPAPVTPEVVAAARTEPPARETSRPGHRGVRASAQGGKGKKVARR